MKNETQIQHPVIDQIFMHDSRHMTEIPANSVHLMVTSPPYNVTKQYDANLTLNEYLQLLHDILSEVHRVLVPSGIIALNIANVGRKPYIPLDCYIIEILQKLHFLVFQEIIWNKAASSGGSCAWGSWQSASNPSLRDIHEYIILATKSTNLQDITFSTEIKQGYPKSIEGRPLNINLDEYFTNIWSFQTESAKRVNHPAPFRVELPFRIIKMFSKKNEIVLDPFLGSGTVAIAALLSQRHYIGYDINPEYIQNAKVRIENFLHENQRNSLDTYIKR